MAPPPSLPATTVNRRYSARRFFSEGLEQHLLGLKVGDKTTFSLEPDAAFGVPSPDLIQYFSRREFMDAGEPEIGAIMLLPQWMAVRCPA